MVVVLVIRGGAGRAERQLVTNYVRAWSGADYNKMYSLLDPDSRDATSQAKFAAAYRRDATVATVKSITPVRVGKRVGDQIPVRMVVATRLFGTLRETVQVPLAGSGSDATVRFVPSLLFPGLRGRERLARHMSLPPRATLFAADGTPLAQGPDRTSPISDVAIQITGVLGPIPKSQAVTYAAQGFPPDAKVGLDGLERAFQSALAGTPGGSLLAGHRVLAHRDSQPGHDVTTTIDPTIERAAVAALAGRYGGIAAMNPRTGALLALAGVAFSALQPPGSTMKIITTTGALQAGIVKLSSVFPYSTAAILDGYTLHNAGGASYGTLASTSAAICCSVRAAATVPRTEPATVAPSWLSACTTK